MKNRYPVATLPLLLGLVALTLSPLLAPTSADPAPRMGEVQPDAIGDAIKRLDKVTLDAAKLGLEDVTLECLGLLGQLGASEGSLERLRGRVEKALAKSKGAPKESKLKSLTRAVNLAANALAKAAEESSEEEATRLYGLALALDSRNEAAHLALQHALCDDGEYRSTESVALFERRQDIALALQAARTLEVNVEEVTPGDPTLIELYGDSASAARFEGLLVESSISSKRLTELLRASVRAMAFSNWLVSGELKPIVLDGNVIHMPQRDAYREFIRAALKAGRIPAEYKKDALLYDGWPIHSRANKGLGPSLFQGDTLVTLSPLGTLGGDLVQRYDGALPSSHRSVGDVRVPHWLTKGHGNYVCLSFLGCALPLIRVLHDEDGTVSTGSRLNQKLRNAGLIGCQSWLEMLTREGRVPSLGRCVVEQEGLLKDTLLLRATSSAQWLSELNLMGEYAKRCKEVWKLQPRDTGTILQRTESVIECEIPEFDEAWERWLLGGDGAGGSSVFDLVQRASPGAKQSVSVLAGLNELRKEAGLESVELEARLSQGARAHAEYLELHPEQKGEWPGAHMEYAESEGFSSKGAWAGAHGVIAFNGSQSCLEEWFGTFYHRVPLTHPGLLSVGFGAAGETSVVDCVSLQDPTGAYEGHYPFDGQTSVPLRFTPELPNPVPEREDQRTLGYPITYQIGPDWGDGKIELKLLRGGTEVPCFLSTPASPTNPKVAPHGCYCLMAKEPLRADTEYEVVVDGPGHVKGFSFKTGK